ncbi:MAG: RHS repeat protein, partial [Opitutales bacterium]|nr:RHS repeat protein [Opitutales bacterium]
ISARDARGHVTTYAYDADDRLISQAQTLDEESVVTSFEYDAMNRQTKTTFADGTFVASAYDLRGNKTAEYGNASYPVLFSFDALNQKTGMQTFRMLAGSPEELANLTGGDATAWSYDPATGLLLAKTDAAGKSVSYTYTAAGLLASRTWARGIATTYAYDAWNRLVSTTYSDSTPAVSQTYDALGRAVSTSDASGTRTTTYDAYGNVSSESLLADGKTHLLTELRDGFGRSLGYTYAKNGSVQQTAGMTYAEATGRLATAGFVHGGAQKTFSYNYLSGTNLLESLVCPSNLTIMHTYEAERDLVAGITIQRGTSTNVVLRNYTYDALGRPLTRSTSRNGTTQNDTFGYNARSELTSATLGSDNYAYAFDHIGNRNTASESGTQSSYSANALNQYTGIVQSSSSSHEEGDRATSAVEALTYDADGNATLVQTSTGTWQITYNGENRPIRFRNEETDTTVDCGYDSQGRRFEKKVTVAGTVELHHRYIYRGYLQIAALDLKRSAHPALWLVTWDPSQPTATRPLAIHKDGTWFTYGDDITKNICEVFGQHGYIRTEYSYAPFGAVTESGDVTQPFQ